MSDTLVKPEKLLKELSSLWTEMGKEELAGSDRSAGVLRAVTMTFILAVEEGDDESAAGEALAQLMHEHPSRAIVLRLRKHHDAALEGRAFAQCWMPFGRRHQICCEQIEISAGVDHFEDAVSLLHGLLAPDLPVVFWSRSPRLFELESFRVIADLSHKVILDSRTHQDPLATIRFLHEQMHAGRLYGDLTWTRLTRWRQTVSSVFERADCQNLLHSLKEAEIAYTHEPLPTAVTYLGAWLRSALGEQFPIRHKFIAGDMSWQIRAIRLASTQTDISIDRTEKGIVEVQLHHFHSRSVFELLDEARLVREELAILGRDPIFARVVEIVSQSSK